MILIQSELLSRFRIQELVTIEPVDAGPFSQVLKVVALVDGQRQVWCVKRNRNSQPERLAFEANLAASLRGAGLTVIPNTIPTREGQNWFPVGAEFWSVTDWVDADPPGDWLSSPGRSIMQCRAAAKSLNEFHRVCRLVEATLTPGWQTVAQPFLPRLSFEAERSLSSASTLLLPDDPVHSCIKDTFPRLRQSLSQIAELAVPTVSPGQIIHGDYHPCNILFTAGKVAAILDFDYARLDAIDMDVGYAAFMFAWDNMRAALDEERAQAFVEAYDEQAFRFERTGQLLTIGGFTVIYWLLDEYVRNISMRPALRTTVLAMLEALGKPIEQRWSKLYS